MKIAILFAGLVLLPISHLHAQAGARLYAVTFYTPRIITIDTNSGAGTLVTNLPSSPLDIAASDGRLWLLTGGSGVERLFHIDAWTGAVLAQKSFTSSIGGGEGAMDFAPDGTALAVRVSESVGTLFRIDMALTNVVLITPEGGLSPSLDGLAFDANGILYGLSQNADGFGLYTVNTNTGTTTLVGPLGITFPGTGGAVGGLAFAPDGMLFAAAGNPTESRLYRVNKFTGAATLIGSIGFGGVSGIRFFVPPPGPLQIARAGEQLRLSWPHLRGGALQVANSVTGIWNSASLPLTTNGTDVFTFVTPTQREAYFRLGL
jgi:hypothetical protein